MGGERIVVLGLDPGSRCTGYGLISEESGCLRLIRTGTVRPQADLPLSDRLGEIYARLSSLIQEFAPDEAAVEDVFVSRNTSSALKLGQARGAALVACAAHRLPVFPYEPALIKKTLVGAGRAEKSQVAFMVGQILGKRPDWSQDSSDALAAGICHLNLRRWRHVQARTGS
ncbi:MAG: crossover junction endodeoxyribonuclease RuvC [Desulfovermiculus sp.]